MRTRGIAAGLMVAFVLGLVGPVAAQQDYATLPTEYDQVAKMLAAKKLDLPSIVKTAEQRLAAKAVNTSVGIEDGKLKIVVEIAAPGIYGRVEIDPDTGKVASTTEKFYDNKVSLLDAIAEAEKRTGGKVTAAVMQNSRQTGEMEIVVRLAAPGVPFLYVTIHPETGKVATAPAQGLPDADVDLLAAIEAAEKDAKGVATNVNVARNREGESEVTVTIVGDKVHKRVKVDAATGKVLSTEDLPIELPGEPVKGEPITTASGLMYYDVEEGQGEALEPNGGVKVEYTGWMTDGKEFDSSRKPKSGRPAQPMTIQNLTRGAIPGFLEGLRSMKVGGKRKLVIPYKLGYGEQGNPRAGIPPKATLIFDVEAVEAIEPAPPATRPAARGPALKPTIRPATRPAP